MIFRTVSGTLSRSANTKATTTSLSFKVELEGSRHRIELETGEVLRDPRSYTSSAIEAENPAVSLSIYQDGGGRAKIDEGEDRIGTIRYLSARDPAFALPEASTIAIRFYLDDLEYGRLADAVSRGALPKRFIVSESSGIQHGGIEGESMRWNSKGSAVLPIEQVAWTFDADAPEFDGPTSNETEAEKKVLSILADIRALLGSARWFAFGAIAVYVASHWWKR